MMSGGLVRMVAKAAAGLLILLAFVVAQVPARASSQPVAVYNPLALTHALHGPRPAAAVQQAQATPCSGPGCVDGPACCVGMSCPTATGQLAASPTSLPASLSVGSGAFLTVLAVPYAGTVATPTPPPPRLSV